MERILNWFCISDLYRYPNLFGKLVYRDFFERFVGSALGFLWAIINPLVLMGMYVLLFSVILKIKFFENGTHVDFGLFLFCGMIPWLSYQETLTKAAQVVFNYRHLILQVRFPLNFLPIHISVTAFVQEVIALFLFILFVWWYNASFPPHILYFILLLPAKFIFTCGASFLLSALAVQYRDFVQLIHIVMMVWFFGSPIVYPASQVPNSIYKYYILNPFVSLVEMYRYAILGDGVWKWNSYFYFLFCAFLVYALGYLYFRRKSRTFAYLV